MAFPNEATIHTNDGRIYAAVLWTPADAPALFEENGLDRNRISRVRIIGKWCEKVPAPFLKPVND